MPCFAAYVSRGNNYSLTNCRKPPTPTRRLWTIGVAPRIVTTGLGTNHKTNCLLGSPFVERGL